MTDVCLGGGGILPAHTVMMYLSVFMRNPSVDTRERRGRIEGAKLATPAGKHGSVQRDGARLSDAGCVDEEW